MTSENLRHDELTDVIDSQLRAMRRALAEPTLPAKQVLALTNAILQLQRGAQRPPRGC